MFSDEYFIQESMFHVMPDSLSFLIFFKTYKNN